MELWIRSQNRNELIPIKEELIQASNCIIYQGNIIGGYKSKERALEVLDEITEHLDYLNIGNIDRVDEKGFRVSTIYYMPKE